MKIYTAIVLLFLSTLFLSCTKEYDCLDNPIVPLFINFSSNDLDTLTLRKFKAEDNFHTLIDTISIITDSNEIFSYYDSSAGAALILHKEIGIRNGYDWQLCIPSKNKTICISKIISEKNQGKRGWGIFSMDPSRPCINKIYSCRIDSSFIDFSDNNNNQYYFNITN